MREKSCGTITFTRVDGQIKYLLTKTDYGVYGFAKGHVEQGESENRHSRNVGRNVNKAQNRQRIQKDNRV